MRLRYSNLKNKVLLFRHHIMWCLIMFYIVCEQDFTAKIEYKGQNRIDTPWTCPHLTVEESTSIPFPFYPITLGGRRGTTDEFATIPFHLDLFSAALVKLAKSIPVHSLILTSHLFFCLPLFLFPFTVPCRFVFAKPEDLETWPNHLSFRFLTRVRSSSYSPKYNVFSFLAL